MDPQTPIVPETPKVERGGHWITIAAMAVFVLLSLAAVAFLYYQNQQLKTMLASYQTSSPAPTATTDPTVNWKTYTNSFYKYSFMYPNNLTLTTQKGGVGLVNASADTKYFVMDISGVVGEYVDVSALNYFADLISPNQWERNDIEVGGQKIEAYKNKKVTTDKNKILYRFRNQDDETQVDFILTYSNEKSDLQETLNQILSTFKFIGSVASPSAKPVACTLEAKICPDGSSVGRTGPNCEFAPCPTP